MEKLQVVIHTLGRSLPPLATAMLDTLAVCFFC